MNTTKPAWETEVVELHAFFAGWLGGTSPKTEAVYGRLVDTMAPEFAIITPGGVRIARDALLAQLWDAHNSRPRWQIWIEQPHLHAAAGDLTIAMYQEWQRDAVGMVTARWSSVVFRDAPGTPNGLAWLHVHETWMPVHAPVE